MNITFIFDALQSPLLMLLINIEPHTKRAGKGA